MKRHRLLRVFGVSFIAYVAMCFVVGSFAAEFTLHPHRRELTPAQKAQAPAWAKDDGGTLSDVAIKAVDGIRLNAWLVEPEDSNKDVVVLLHGRGGNRLEMVNYADIFLAHGYSVLMPDARNHGSSGGTLTTYGLLERDDIHQWVQWLAQAQHPNCVFGFGESMGAAELLQSLKVEPGFCAIAAECPFSTFRESAYDRMGQPFHTGPWLGRTALRPVVEGGFLYSRLRYGLNMDQVSPESSISKAKTPILLIHGQADTNIPIRHSRRMVALNPEIVLWEVPNTGHSNAIDTSAQELEKKLVGWFEKHDHKRPQRPQ